jgi:hypothetical protein
MTKEAMKLALEALQTLHDENMDYLTRNKLGGENNQCMVFAREAITALREALAKPDFWEGYVPEPVKPAQCKYPKCSYPCTDLPDCRDAEQPAQQEPVAFLVNGTRFKISYDSRQSGGQIHGIPPELGGRWVAFVAADDDCHLKLTSPPAQRKPLTDEAIATVYWGATGQSLRPQDNVLAHNFARSIEAAHGIKENT